MFKFSQSLNLLDFDLDKYTKTLDRVAGQIFREAIREWLRVFIVHNEFPVETGMAKATLAPLARWLGNVNFSGITPEVDDYYHDVELTIANVDAGEERSRFTLIDDKNHPLNFIYQFYWEESVLHYWHAQYYNSPYNRGIAGELLIPDAEKAAITFFNITFPRRLPKLKDFLKNG